MGGTKPSVCEPPILENIPAELRDIPHWLLWRWENRNDKWTKPPLQPNGSFAKADDPSTWAPFDYAETALDTSGRFDGLGFVLTQNDPFCGFDFDNCLDASFEITDKRVEEFVIKLNSYTEMSPSLTGLRVIVRAQLPPGGRKKADIECYDQGRYLTITGKTWGQLRGIADRQAEVLAIHAAIFANGNGNGNGKHTNNNHRDNSPKLDDIQLLTKARRAENAAKFIALFDRGDWKGQGYKSRSEAHLALCSLLAFWTGRDAARIDSLFRQSGLCDDRWDREDYRALTIGKAIAGCKNIYTRNTTADADEANEPTDGVSYAPPSPDFKINQFDPDAMLAEALRRFAYLKELDNFADLDDYVIRHKQGFCDYAAKFNGFTKDDKTDRWKKINTATRWLESPNRIELVKPVYEPGLAFPICDIKGRPYFNFWRGFAAEAAEGDVGLYLKLLDHVFEGMPAEREHFLKFHGYACQHPNEKMMHALLLISRQQGIGKSLIGEVIGYGLWGEDNFSEVEHENLTASFNTYLKHKKFILGNEMLLSSSTAIDKRKDANTLKNAITRDRCEVNEKNIRQYYTRDVIVWMLTSNFDDAVWLDREDDRRLHISRLKQQVPLAKKYGKDFGETVKNWAKSQKGAAALHYFFLHYPCEGFTAKAAPPLTDGQRIVYETGLSTLDKLVRDVIEDRESTKGSDLVRLDDIRQIFMLRHEKMQPPSDPAIGSAISRFGGVYIPEKVQWTDQSSKKQLEVRTWAIRNAEYWQRATRIARAEHYQDPGGHPAQEEA